MEIIIATNVTDKGRLSIINKPLLQINKKRQVTHSKNEANTWTGISLIKTSQLPVNILKDAQSYY